MAEPDITDLTAKLYKVLEQLDPDMRRRALAGALGMLGEPISAIAGDKKDAGVEVDGDYPTRAEAERRLHRATRTCIPWF